MEFCKQIDSALTPNCKLIITGDANLCEERWKSEDFVKKSIAKPLLECREQNGLQIQRVGLTFQSDHAMASGAIPTSALDHVYNSDTIEGAIQVKKLQTSATDHLPVIISYSLDKNKVKYKHSITKRSYKHFTKENWNHSLESQDWSRIGDCENVDEMVAKFDANIEAALNEVAPIIMTNIYKSCKLKRIYTFIHSFTNFTHHFISL